MEELGSVAECDTAKQTLRRALQAKQISAETFKQRLGQIQGRRRCLVDLAEPPALLAGAALDRFDEVWCAREVTLRDATGQVPWPMVDGRVGPPQGAHVPGCNCGYCQDGGLGDCCYTLKGVLTTSDCAALVRTAQEHNENCGGWDQPNRKRHRQFPTTDLALSDLRYAEVFGVVRKKLSEFILPAIGTIFNVPASRIELKEAFIVKYAAVDGAQHELPLHTDGSKYSFNLLLSDANDFEGGASYPARMAPSQGDLLIHKGDLRHAGNAVTRGTRHVLVGFVN